MRFNLSAFLCLFLLLSAPVVAHAFASPITNEKGKAILSKMGHDLTPLAARFGCPDFAWGDFIDKGEVAALVYVPKGADFKKTPRKVSMSVHALPGKPEEDKKEMNALAQRLVDGFKKSGKITRQDVFHNAKDEPGLFIAYTIAANGKTENGAGVFLRLTSRTAAFIQLQSSGKPLSADEVANVKSLIAGTAAGGSKEKPKK